MNRWELIHQLCHRCSYSRTGNVTISVTIGAAGLYVYDYLSLFRCRQLHYPVETSMRSNLNSIACASWAAARTVDNDGGRRTASKMPRRGAMGYDIGIGKPICESPLTLLRNYRNCRNIRCADTEVIQSERLLGAGG